MFFILSKIFGIIASPLTWIVGGLLICLFLNKPKQKPLRNKILIAVAAITILFGNDATLKYCKFLQTKAYRDQTIPEKNYRVAVIMGGFAHFNTQNDQLEPFRDRDARLWETIRLYRRGFVKKILVSGDGTINIRPDGTSDSLSLIRYMAQAGVNPKDIWLEPLSANTHENATNSVQMLISKHIHPEDCLIVTSASHMSRSLDCFLSEGFDCDGYAVNIYPKPQHLSLKDFLPSWRVIYEWQELLHEWIGGIAYSLVGYQN